MTHPDLTHRNMIDITEPTLAVEVEIRSDGKVIWIHVDGITVMRICRVPALIIRDHRPKAKRKR